MSETNLLVTISQQSLIANNSQNSINVSNKIPSQITYNRPPQQVYDVISIETITINHALGYYPTVIILDIDGNECEAAIEHISDDSIQCDFSPAFSGKIILS